ncbi:MAG: Signal transduction histidine-protein kinase BarA [Verrucomicrobiota bacterium]|jgi:hypothetical protein
MSRHSRPTIPGLLGLLLTLLAILGLAPHAGAAPLRTVIPPPANLWERDNLYVSDKDTNSVILNGNALYVASLTPYFPEIRTPEDLVGKTDYDFYPPADAEKFRADDARVMTSGVGYQTIEENQIEGGQRSFVFVDKQPLRDAAGVIFGVRVKFYFIPQPNQTLIPPPANRWEAEHLFILDKDTNSTFINANDLYLRSLQPAFPEIQSITNFIGRNDYAFYPEDLANKYREDDARVMASGVPLETIEEYTQDGVRGYVFTSKTPLRNAAGVIFGLHIEFYLIPAPNQTVIPPPRNAHEAATVIIIDKDTTSTFINANDLYIRSLQAAFPEIKSVTNLIGKNDYAFYPEDLAEKYRADDARVLATGRPFVTIEANEVGGVRRFVHVRKEPLRDRSRRIFGLRITAFPIPANEQALDNNFRGGAVNAPRRLPQAATQTPRPARGVKR